jgi:hypothetical protein
VRSRDTTVIIRAVGFAPLVAGLFAGCTWSGSLLGNPTPTATPTATRTATPTVTRTHTQTPPPPESTPTVPPTPDLRGTATVSARRAVCERYVAFLSGRERDDALLDNPDVQALAQQSADLVMCGSVVRDSDLLCRRFFPTERGPSIVCRHMWSIFHELRAHPKGRSFMFDDIDREEWQSPPSVDSATCDALQEALRSGDVNKCARSGDLESVCRAYMRLDQSLCRVHGRLAEVELPSRKAGEPEKLKLKTVLEESCRETIESRAPLARGLTAIAKTGPPRERELAKAALGQTDACASYAQSALQSCVENAGRR